MVTIRLSRFGRKKGAFYRIVAVDSRKKASGANLEVLGFWNPLKKILKVEKERIGDWISKGAQMSTSVKKMLENS